MPQGITIKPVSQNGAGFVRGVLGHLHQGELGAITTHQENPLIWKILIPSVIYLRF